MSASRRADRRTTRQRLVVRAALATALAGLAFGASLWRRERIAHPEYAMRTFDACVRTGDADGVYRVLGAPEKEAGLTRERFRRFFHDVYAPRMAGYRATETFRIEPGTDPAVQMVGDREYRDAAGKTVVQGAYGTRTEGAAVCDWGVSSLMLTLFQTYRDPRIAESTDETWLRALRDLRPRLEAAGLQGAFLQQGVEAHFVTWKQWTRQLDGRIARRRAAASVGS